MTYQGNIRKRLNTKQTVNSYVLGGIDKYDGRANIDKYLSRFDRRAKIEGWTKEQSAEILKYSCVGRAMNFLEANKDIEKLSYEELCETLRIRFRSGIDRINAIGNFLKVKQGKMTVDEYAYKIESICARYRYIIPELQDVKERNLITSKIFVMGLKRSIKIILSPEEHENFYDVVRIAKRVEISERQNKNYYGRRSCNFSMSREANNGSQNIGYEKREARKGNNCYHTNSVNCRDRDNRFDFSKENKNGKKIEDLLSCLASVIKSVLSVLMMWNYNGLTLSRIGSRQGSNYFRSRIS